MSFALQCHYIHKRCVKQVRIHIKQLFTDKARCLFLGCLVAIAELSGKALKKPSLTGLA